MKKQLLSVFILLMSSVAFSQTIPNGGFENWTSINYEQPQYWMTANQQNIGNGITGPLTVVKTTDAYHGTYAVKMTTLLSGNDTLQSFIADGNPGFPPQGGVPYAQTPTGIRFYYKCNIVPGDSGLVIVQFKKAGTLINSHIYHITGNQSSYTLFSQTFNPALTQAPDTILFACASSNLMTKVGVSPGSMLQIDSVSFTGVSSQPANFGGDFETWQTTTNNTPNGWNSNGALQSTDKYSGTYALELTTTPPGFGNNSVQVGQVTNTKNSNYGPPTGGAPYATQVDTLVFYYKYLPANYPLSTDSAQVNMSFYKTGVGIWGTGMRLPYSANYKKIIFPFNLSQTPDTVQISISSSYWPASNADIGSDLKIDEFYFKSQRVPVSNFIMPATGCKGVPIQLTDNSTNMPTTWQWFMTGGSPPTSTSQNPIVTYTSNSTPHTYTISMQAADSFGLSTFISKTITINGNPSVSATSPTICLGNHGLMTASGAVTYTWNMGAMAANIFVSPTVTTTYSVMGTDANGCKDSATSLVSVLSPQIPSICMVSTDSTTNYKYNIVYWNNTNLSVDSFIVYRLDNSSGNYLRIGAVNKDSLSQFVDKDSTTGGPHGGNPQYASWKYKLQIRDTCGNYGSLSPYHQSVFFTQSGSVFNFSLYIDSGYTSLPTGYGLYRDDNNTGNFQLLVVVGSSPANDPNYNSYPNAVYRIDALGFNCTPTTLRLSGNNNVDAARVKSHSNTNNNRGMTTGINKVTNTNAISIYPNPATNSVNIGFATSTNRVTVKVLSILGSEVFNQTYNQAGTGITLDISKYESGAYLIQITTDNISEIKRIVKE